MCFTLFQLSETVRKTFGCVTQTEGKKTTRPLAKYSFKCMHEKKPLQTLKSAMLAAPWIRHTGRLTGSGGANRFEGKDVRSPAPFSG